jgi:ABC-type multidrug transport system permease subunit
MFGSAQPSLLEFPFERPMFMREYAVGTYSTVAYTLGKFLLEIPIAVMQSLVQMIIIYFMAELQGNFFVILSATFSVGMVSSAVAILLGCLVTDPKQAVEMIPVVLVPQILFAGFFIRTSQIPFWLRWAQYLCSLKYGINIFLINEFASFRESCTGDAAYGCALVKDTNDVEASDAWVYYVVLLGLFLVFRTLAMYFLSKKALRFY